MSARPAMSDRPQTIPVPAGRLALVNNQEGGHLQGQTPAAYAGRDVYIDVAGWHLFLKDVRLGGGGVTLAQGLAQQLGQQIDGGGFKSSDLQPLLQKVSALGMVADGAQ